MSQKIVGLVLSLALAVLVTVDHPLALSDPEGPGGPSGSVPPPRAAASIIPNAGSCIRFISVYVPVGGGEYAVGISFAYLDLNGDGRYSPGTDKMAVCVNCADACGFYP
jgi:hypothetical protein